MKQQKHIVIVGAGPGGLSTAMLLAHRGFKVTVFEQADRVGGRNARIQLGDFHFDTGPTFLMMKFFLDETFAQTGRSSEDYLNFMKLNPMYRVKFDEREIMMYTQPEKVTEQIRQLYPGNEDGFDRFLQEEDKRFQLFFKSLRRSYNTVGSLFNKDLLRALPLLAKANRSLFDYLGQYFKNEELRLAFTFQAKYLGMSPWDCPSLFSTLSYLEHKFGIYHVEGGLCSISEAMAKVAEEEGAALHLNSPVQQLLLEGEAVTGVRLANGDEVLADEVIVNADFSYTMRELVPKGIVKKWSPKKLQNKKYSCSTFMLYLGLDKVYDMPHHNLVSATNYKQHTEEIFKQRVTSQDTSFYICNPSVLDRTMAPAGKSAMYILVPTPNTRADIDWDAIKEQFRDMVLDTIEQKMECSDLRDHIEVEKIITPADWEREYNVHTGAVFNLSHHLSQMMYWRPHNKFEELDNMYLVGGGTNPGSALPTIYESGRLVSNLISDQYGVEYSEPVFSVFE